MTNLSTREILDNIYNGKTALRRQHPKAGETPYYYLNPNRKNFYSTPAPEDIANVNSPDEPNPFLQPKTQSDLSATSSTIGSFGLNDITNSNNGLFGETDTSDTTTDSLWNNQPNDTTGDIWNTKDIHWNTDSSANNDSQWTNNNLYSSSYTSPFSSNLSSNGLSTDDSLSTSTDNMTWDNGLGLNQTSSNFSTSTVSPFGTGNIYSYTSTPTSNPFGTSSTSMQSSTGLTSPFNTSFSSTGLSTDNALSNASNESAWFNDGGLGMINTGMGTNSLSPFGMTSTQSQPNTSLQTGLYSNNMSTKLNPITINELSNDIDTYNLSSKPKINLGKEVLVASNGSVPRTSTTSFSDNKWDDSICSEPYVKPVDIDINDPGAIIGEEYTSWNYPPKDKEEEIRRYKKNIAKAEGPEENRFYNDTVCKLTAGPGFLIPSREALDKYPICKLAIGNNPARLLNSAEKDDLYNKGTAYGKRLYVINSKGKRECTAPLANYQQHIFNNVYIPQRFVDEHLDKLVRQAYQQCENSFNHTPIPWAMVDPALRELCVQKVYNSGKSFDKYDGTRKAIFNNEINKLVDIIKNKNIPEKRLQFWYDLANQSMKEQNARGPNSIRNDAIRRGYNEDNLVPKKK